jgi:hypothetical protein
VFLPAFASFRGRQSRILESGFFGLLQTIRACAFRAIVWLIFGIGGSFTVSEMTLK